MKILKFDKTTKDNPFVISNFKQSMKLFQIQSFWFSINSGFQANSSFGLRF